MSESAGRPAPRCSRLERDLAPVIAAVLIVMGKMPCGYSEAMAYTLRIWPNASDDEADRGYEIACECWEDDYLFDHFLRPFTVQ